MVAPLMNKIIKYKNNQLTKREGGREKIQAKRIKFRMLEIRIYDFIKTHPNENESIFYFVF